MDLQYLKELLAIFDASSATELMIEEEGASVSISKRGPDQVVTQVAPAPQVHVQAHGAQTQPAPAQATPAAAPAAEENTHTILSPIVGTFYSSPSPDAPAFVQVGSRISAGQTLCIVEAMKLMNEIESDVSGTIVSILANNAQAVEYNQPLFIVKPD
ncbi:MAG: acetyl-CoA carboxylase biotin carboxyl carrier protein [Bacteroidota bacterium]|nr:acetyl-CoA carboxylase biotin carboxyl carrier protein [bacterium]NBP64901.1 acetyl-CoA carboxylase biotin carboxyl carrier protein [Bacteroidota bacterium]